MKEKSKLIPKFKIDDIVCMDDDFSYNPAEDTLSIGKIEAIHIIRGDGVFMHMDGTPVDKPRITYSISGFSLRPEESKINLYKEISE